MFQRLSILLFQFNGDKREAAERARRWSRAFREDPRLASDLIELGRLLELPAERREGGVTMADPIDPIRMAQERGETILAVKLLALGGTTTDELNQLIREIPNDVY